MLGLGYVYRCFFGKTKDELAPPPPLKKRKLMERRVENDASSNLAQAKEVRATCEEAREASKERIRQEKERHSGVMSLLNKQLMGCEANLDEAEKDVESAKEEFDIATRFTNEMAKHRRLCDAPAAGSSVPNLSGAKITLVEDGTAADKAAVPES